LVRFRIDNGVRLELPGCVVWTNPVKLAGDNPNPGMGVQFRDVSAETREQLVSLVRTVAYLRTPVQN